MHQKDNRQMTDDNRCKTKYPIVLVHGIGYNDVDYPRYWGRIPEALTANGAKVYFGQQDGFGKVAKNAAQLKVELDMIKEKDGYDKVNLIAHSKGGIDARYMISELGMAGRVASLTTMATPHRGIRTIDIFKEKSPALLSRFYGIFNTMLRVDGGDVPNDNSAYDQLTYDYMSIFNEYVIDAQEVYYQSFAFDMKGKFADPALYLFYTKIKQYEGDNDGLVPVSSAKWGNFRGVYSGPDGKGVSHPAVCDGREKLTEKKGLGNISDFYVDLVSELREMGY